MIKLLFSKLGGYLAAVGAFMITIFMYKHEKKKRKQAEIEREAASANIDLLVRREEIVTDLAVERQKDDKEADKMYEIQKTQLERLKNAPKTDNIGLADELTKLLNENSNKD